MSEYVFLATGDVGPNRPEPDSIFDGVREALAEGDLVFGQLEPCLTDRGTPLPQCRLPLRGKPAGAGAIRRAGYDLLSFATNHCMDWAREGFFDTLENLRAAGITPVGAGENIDAARRPEILTLPDGTTVGFLAYCSILPQDYWATEERPGCAPLRGVTAYVPVEHDQPQTPVRMFSFPHPDDLDALLADIAALRPKVDILCVSMHWGIHFIPAVLADYQRYAAHFAVDAGADLVIGHHTHILKPFEVYHGKLIAYSLANFALEPPTAFADNLENTQSHKEIQALNPDTAKNPEKKMPDDSYKTVLLRCTIADGRLQKAYLLPVQLDGDSNPRVCRPEEPEFAGIVEYLKEITAHEKLPDIYRVEGNMVRVL